MHVRQPRRERSGHSNEFLPERKLITVFVAGLLFATVTACFIPNFQCDQKIRLNAISSDITRVNTLYVYNIPRNVIKFSVGFLHLANLSSIQEKIEYKGFLTVYKGDSWTINNITIKNLVCNPTLPKYVEIYSMNTKKISKIDINIWVKTVVSKSIDLDFRVSFECDPLFTVKTYYYLLASFVFLWIWFILQKLTCGSAERKWFVTIMKSYYLVSSIYSLLHFITATSPNLSILYTLKIIVVSTREMFSIAYVSTVMLPLMPPSMSKRCLLGLFMCLMLTVFIATFIRQCLPLIKISKKQKERFYSLCLGYRESIRISFFALVFMVGQAVRKKRMSNKYIVFHYMTFIPVNFIPLIVDFVMDVLKAKKPPLHFVCNELYDMVFIAIETVRLLPALKAMSSNNDNIINEDPPDAIVV